jgi:hypothetical protein
MENHTDVHDYCNVLAWDIEQAIFNKFKTDADDTGQCVSNEYREKVGKTNAFKWSPRFIVLMMIKCLFQVRCLRFNLQVH